MTTAPMRNGIADPAEPAGRCGEADTLTIFGIDPRLDVDAGMVEVETGTVLVVVDFVVPLPRI